MALGNSPMLPVLAGTVSRQLLDPWALTTESGIVTIGQIRAIADQMLAWADREEDRLEAEKAAAKALPSDTPALPAP